MISRHPSITDSAIHTMWGLEPVQLHDRFWAARGIEVVRQGEPSDIVEGAELFLLTGPSVLTVFKLNELVETLSWLKPVLLYVRVQDDREHGYRERAVTDDQRRFVRFERVYDQRDAQLARVALTGHREIALAWQTAANTSEGWRLLRRSLKHDQHTTASVQGRIFDRSDDQETVQFIRGLVDTWKRPDATINGIRKVRNESWTGLDTTVDPQTRFVGPVWVGAGRRLNAQNPIIGPAVLWDNPDFRPKIESLHWDEIEPTEVFARSVRPREQTFAAQKFKRLCDIVFSLIVLTITLPLYPLIMLAIYIENGRPFFFAHRRETSGGKSFPCIKFRSMRRDAEAYKAKFSDQNRADGPQFFIEDDPRLTRVGRFIRRTNVDELPQFINVLLGHMSVVGPRPSPFEENQFCPAWREARLSVRPGITGLWQVKRSRLEGMDFQEWIKYDIEYVENASWRLDLIIILKTIPIVLQGLLR